MDLELSFFLKGQNEFMFYCTFILSADWSSFLVVMSVIVFCSFLVAGKYLDTFSHSRKNVSKPLTDAVNIWLLLAMYIKCVVKAGVENPGETN